MAARKFSDLEKLARERGYSLRREGRFVVWWRNEDPTRTYHSDGVGEAWDAIILDFSSEKPSVGGERTTKENKHDRQRAEDRRPALRAVPT